jgi:hypothetical protein
LKTSECSSVIAFENLSRIVSLCDFQKYLEFLGLCDHIDSLMAIVHLDCVLATISEEMSLKSIILVFLNQNSSVFFYQSKSSKQVQRCMNWKDKDL